MLLNEDFRYRLHLFASPNSKEIFRAHCLRYVRRMHFISHLDCSFFVRAIFEHERLPALMERLFVDTVASGNRMENDLSGQRGSILRDNATRTPMPKKYAEKCFLPFCCIH